MAYGSGARNAPSPTSSGEGRRGSGAAATPSYMIIPRRHTGEGEELTSVAAPAVQEDGGRAAAPTPMQSARRGKGNRRQPRAEQSRAGSHHYQGLRCFWHGAAGTGVKSIARTVPSLIGGHTMRAPFVPCVLVNLFWYLVPFPPSSLFFLPPLLLSFLTI